MKKQEFKKMRRGLGIFKATKHSKIGIIGVPEGEKEEQEIENLFEKNNEGELPQSGKGNRLPGSPGSSESQRSWTQGGTHPHTS